MRSLYSQVIRGTVQREVPGALKTQNKEKFKKEKSTFLFEAATENWSHRLDELNGPSQREADG